MGSNAQDHGFGPDKVIGQAPVWRFTIGQTSTGLHIFSPPMTRSAAKAGAALMLSGDDSGARAAWGQDVAGWLDDQGSTARGELYEAAREMMRT